MESFGGSRIRESQAELSNRELQLLERAGQGMTDQAIAADLGISLATVATYWGRIRIKFGPLSRTEIVANHLRAIASEQATEFEKEVNILRHQIETVGQNEDLFEIAVSMAPVAMLISTVDDGTIQYVNQKLSCLLGFLSDQIVGRPITDLIHPDHHAGHEARRSQFASEDLDPGAEVSAAVRAVTYSGDEIWVTSDSSLIVVGGRRLAVIAVYPVG